MTIEELHERFSITDAAEVVEGNGGLAKVRIHAGETSGEIYLHGAQVTSWKPRGRCEAIFLSDKSRWQEGIAIRGGIPICFPWFRTKAGDPNAPSHGIVRTRTWQLESIALNDDAVKVSMSIQSDDQTRRSWPADFKLMLNATFGSRLKLELEVTNTGPAPFRFEEALHTYHRVDNVAGTKLDGLAGAEYLDNTDLNKRKTQQSEILITGPTDRAYMNTKSSIEILDAGSGHLISMEKAGSLTTVVWNPWIEGARTLPDLGNDEWKEMLCVEASNIREFAVDLSPGQKHVLMTRINVNEL